MHGKFHRGTSGGNKASGRAQRMGDLVEEDIRIDMREGGFLRRYAPHLLAEKEKEEEKGKKKKKKKRKGSQFIAWVNDVALDKKYSRYYQDLQVLKSMIIMQQIAPIRKNMYHILAIVDPLNFSAMSAFASLYSMYEQSLPMRFGFILYPSDLLGSGGKKEETSERSKLAKKISNIVYYILRSLRSPKRAGVFLKNLAEWAQGGINSLFLSFGTRIFLSLASHNRV